MKTLLAVLLLSGFAVGAARADAEKDSADLITGMVTALADDNVAGFLKPIDPAMPGFAKLRSQVETLIGRAQVSSSISILGNEGDETRRTLLLDWYVEIRSREVGDKTEPRRKQVRCEATKQGKTWRVVKLELDGLLE